MSVFTTVHSRSHRINQTLELEQHHAAASRAAWPSGSGVSVADSIRLQLCQDAGSVPRPVVLDVDVDAHTVVAAASQGTWKRHVGVTGVVAGVVNSSNSDAGARASGRRPPQL